MMGLSGEHLTQAQQVVQQLGKGLVGPASAVMPCIEACHSVAVAPDVSLMDTKLDRGVARLGGGPGQGLLRELGRLPNTRARD
jgi:hypothetical protein